MRKTRATEVEGLETERRGNIQEMPMMGVKANIALQVPVWSHQQALVNWLSHSNGESFVVSYQLGVTGMGDPF